MPDPESDGRTRRRVMTLAFGLGIAAAGCLGDVETEDDEDPDPGRVDDGEDSSADEDEDDSPQGEEDADPPDDPDRPEVLADDELDVDRLHTTVTEAIEATTFRAVFVGEAIEDGEPIEEHTVAVTAFPADRRGKRAWDVDLPADTYVDWATADSAEYVEDDELYLNPADDEPMEDHRITDPWENFVENGIGPDVDALFELLEATTFDPPEYDEDEDTFRVEATTFEDPEDVGATLDAGAIVLDETGLPVRMDGVLTPQDTDEIIEASVRVEWDDVILERPEWVDEVEEDPNDDPERTPEEIAMDWASPADNVDEVGDIIDATGQESVTIESGASGEQGNYVFDPAIVRIDAGTQVIWEWVSPGHNVAEIDGEGATITGWDDEWEMFGEGHTHAATFEESGVALFECAPHRAQNMRGAIIVE